jgi:uncharacterized HhH-GPD family protein
MRCWLESPLSTALEERGHALRCDQQYPMEHAFRGPWKLKSRFGNLDVDAIASAEPEAFADLAATPPAIHRYGRSMAGRVQQLAAVVRDEYGGHAERIWTEAKDTDELLDRLRTLPGYGDQKARIFAALVGKQLGVRPAGWQEAIGPYAEDGSYRSVADVVDAESLQKVREFKQAAKAEAKAKAGAKPAAAKKAATTKATAKKTTAKKAAAKKTTAKRTARA